MNRIQKTILLAGGLIFVALLLFPPWQQAALREVDYRKDIGRGFILRPATPVAVDCYFVGCQTAPASYFHVVMYFEALIEELTTVACVTFAAVWLFRRRRDGTERTLRSRKTRLIFSMLIALLVPQGQFTLASLLADIPRQIIRHNELWLMPVLILPVLFAVFSGIVYAIVTLTLWLMDARFRRTPPVPG